LYISDKLLNPPSVEGMAGLSENTLRKNDNG